MGRRIHFWFFAAALLLAPLPFGANRPWSAALLALLIALLCIAWPLVERSGRDLPSWPPQRIAVPATLLAAVVGWALLQAGPWLPVSWSHPFWAEASAGLGAGGAGIVPRVALAPEAAMATVMRWLAYAGAFWLALQHGRSRRRARLLVEALALAGGAYAAYGLVVYFSGSQTIVGLPKWAYVDDLTATFVNPNSYADYAGLGLLCAFAALHRRLEGRERGLAALVPHLRRPTAWFFAAAVAIAAALPFTGSRAGMVACVAGLAVLAGALAVGRHGPADRRRIALQAGAIVVLIAAVVAGAMFWLGTGMEGSIDRLRVYRVALEMIARRPLAGIGLGGFGAQFAMDRPVEITTVWTEAHSSYLELAVELGLPAAVVFVTALAWLVVLCLRGIMVRRRDWVFSALGLAASVLLAGHALVDFGPQMPATAATWAGLLGLGLAQAWHRDD